MKLRGPRELAESSEPRSEPSKLTSWPLPPEAEESGRSGRAEPAASAAASPQAEDSSRVVSSKRPMPASKPPTSLST